MRKVAYLRISTPDQCPDRQIDGLKAIADELHIETLSAVSKSRPVYEKLIASLEAGDTLVVWDLDRAYRSAKDAINALDTLRERGIHFHIANLHLDTRTPHGTLIYIIMSGLAQFGRDPWPQRPRGGVAAARLRGKRIGRPPVLSQRQLNRAALRRENGETFASIAGDFEVDGWTLSRALRRTGYRPEA